MKRTDFETRMGQPGLRLSANGDAAYYGACETWSVSPGPYPMEEVKHAKLAVRATGPERSVVVDTFLVAADVGKTPQLAQALARGDDFRGRVGAKDVSFTSIGSDLLLTVMEWSSIRSQLRLRCP